MQLRLLRFHYVKDSIVSAEKALSSLEEKAADPCFSKSYRARIYSDLSFPLRKNLINGIAGKIYTSNFPRYSIEAVLEYYFRSRSGRPLNAPFRQANPGSRSILMQFYDVI